MKLSERLFNIGKEFETNAGLEDVSTAALEAADLLEECELALAFYVAEENWYMDGPLNPDSHKFTGGPARDTLAKLRGETNGDEK